ncbi:MAG TPA: HAD family acid phosphatase, partial [Marmoricola sp.]
MQISSRVASVLTAALVAVTLLTGPTTAPAHGQGAHAATAAKLPTRKQWLRDIHRILHERHARRYIARRAASPSHNKLALNLDIDNTVHATSFGGGPIPEMLALTRFAHKHGVAIMFNTGRRNDERNQTRSLLRNDGYRFRTLCMRHPHEALVHSKQRCRKKFERRGWTLIENIG